MSIPTAIDLGLVRFTIGGVDQHTAAILERVFAHPSPVRSLSGSGHPVEHHYCFHRRNLDSDLRRYALNVDGEPRYPELDLKWAIHITASLMSDQLTDAFTARHITLHAAALALDDCGILVPGASHSGKSTTAAALALSGFRCFSDDVAAFDNDLRLVPFPRAIVLRNGGWYRLLTAFPEEAKRRLIWGRDAIQAWYLDAAPMDAPNEHQDAPTVKLVLVPTLNPDAPTLEPIGRADVVPTLVNQCFRMPSDHSESLETIINLLINADCYRVNMLDIDAAVDAVSATARAKTSIASRAV